MASCTRQCFTISHNTYILGDPGMQSSAEKTFPTQSVVGTAFLSNKITSVMNPLGFPLQKIVSFTRPLEQHSVSLMLPCICTRWVATEPSLVRTEKLSTPQQLHPSCRSSSACKNLYWIPSPTAGISGKNWLAEVVTFLEKSQSVPFGHCLWWTWTVAPEFSTLRLPLVSRATQWGNEPTRLSARLE